MLDLRLHHRTLSHIMKMRCRNFWLLMHSFRISYWFGCSGRRSFMPGFSSSSAPSLWSWSARRTSCPEALVRPCASVEEHFIESGGVDEAINMAGGCGGPGTAGPGPGG